MEFYYKKQLEELKIKCPPETYDTINRLSYRWVFETIEDDKNFQAQAEKNPKIVNGKNDLEICDCYALSFHITTQKSIEHFNHFLSKSPLVYKRLGTNIAEGQLENSDGVSSKIEINGHFNFHHVKPNDFISKFKIIQKL